VLLVREIKKGAGTMTFRDAKGFPMWVGRGASMGRAPLFSDVPRNIFPLQRELSTNASWDTLVGTLKTGEKLIFGLIVEKKVG
jgi:hypothetical protein